MLHLLLGCLINEALYQESKAAIADHDGDGWMAAKDCDDDDATVHPEADERCDGLDSDCDGQADNQAVDAVSWYVDGDGDGFGSGVAPAVIACDQPPGYASVATDCLDTSGGVNPEAVEVPYDDVDQDCDGADLVDVDGDGDPSTVADGKDCDDADATRFGTANEDWTDVWVDNDCDGALTTPLGAYGAVRWLGSGAGDATGLAVASLGDIDGDGVDEAAVASVYASERFVSGGAVHIVSGSAGGSVADQPTVWGGGDRWYLGNDMDGGTDFDDDGVPDLLMGAPGRISRGGAYLVGGAAIAAAGEMVLPNGAIWSVEGAGDDEYWTVVRGVGDFDGDGGNDVAVGAAFTDFGVEDAGAVVMFTPRAGEVVSTDDADRRWLGYYAGERFGDCLGRMGDINGDGLDDLLASSSSGDIAVVIPGGAASGGADAVNISRIARFGTTDYYRVAAIGDVDGDARADVAAVGLTGFIFTSAWAGGVRTEADAEVRLEPDALSPFGDIADIGDQTGDGLSETAISWYEVTTGRYGGVGVLTGDLASVGGVFSVADLPIRAQNANGSGDYGYRIAALRGLDSVGGPGILVGGAADDAGGVDAGAVAVLGVR